MCFDSVYLVAIRNSTIASADNLNALVAGDILVLQGGTTGDVKARYLIIRTSQVSGVVKIIISDM